jgi:tetratricopeptide (TPR) repeat protein
MILTTLAVIFLGAATWGAWAWFGDAESRAKAHLEAGILLLTPGSYPQAIEEFNSALELDPNSWEAYYQRAVANKNIGDNRAAIEDFQAALERKPALVDALTALAGLHRDSGDKQRAIAEISQAIKLKPTTDAYYQRGSTYQEIGDHKKAIEDFTWVILQLRDAPFVYLARANSKRALGDEAGAREDEALAASFDRSKSLN